MTKKLNKEMNLEERSKDIELLEKYSNWLMKHGYLDSDWRDEEPYAIDEFLEQGQKDCEHELIKIPAEAEVCNKCGHIEMKAFIHKDGYRVTIEKPK